MSNAGKPESGRDAREALKSTAGYRRIVSLFDRESFHEIDGLAKSGEGPAQAVAGHGTVNGCPVYAFSQNGDVEGGAMSRAQAEKIKKIYDLAVKTGAPVVGIYDSAGGRLSEGADMLAAYGEILLGANSLSGVVPQISVVLGPCEGTSAMIAAGADFVVMSRKGELSIGTNGEGGSPEEASRLGVCQLVEEDEEKALASARRLLELLPSNNLSGAPVFEEEKPASRAALKDGASAEQIVASVADRDSFLELGAGYGASADTGFARIGGTVAGLIFYGGAIDADSCSKAARFLRFCDSFSIPAVSFVDAEKFATLREASKLSNAYSEATSAKVTLVTGEACGPVYVALAGRGANSDFTLAWPGATVSALLPETAAVFLWNDRLAGSSDPVGDRKKLIEEYRTTEATPWKAAADGFLEDVVDPEDTRAELISALTMLSGKRVSTLPKKHANIQL